MKNLKVARRYAKALLIIGKENNEAETYKEELDRFSDLMTSEKELEQAITNPLYDVGGRKKVLQAIIDKVNISKIMASFLLLLFDKGRFGFLSDINEFYK
ncbi:MAG: F0F1 ATP synthase subunit delta, partial [Thermodesulfobacteriota bacterium]|nr:F0F1 ATP synthase subunit delta [Thermodesulfobacteriota bacterium]